MDMNNLQKTILVIFIWLVGATVTIVSLSYQDFIVAILGMTLPYYLTKELLIENKSSDQE